MSAIWRKRRRTPTSIASAILANIAVVTVFAALGPATAASAAAGPGFVKYYVVTTAFQGQPENLSEIADRFLGSPARSNQIFDLNVGRAQPAGGRLTSPAVIDPGWYLVLPWDAVGAGVNYGLLPDIAPVLPAPPTSIAPPAVPAKRNAPAKPSRPASGGCAGTPNSSGNSQQDWAILRVAPQQAWPYSRGAGVTVAIIDSGVDASVPQLAGRVRAGEDIVNGTGRGNTDCLGSGTAMAGIVAASPSAGGGSAGMAPDATILPVRVAPTSAALSAANQASAIQVATSAGAKVIALGEHIDPALPAVASAIQTATGDGDVVIAAAPTRSSGTPAGAAISGGVIRVGAINIKGFAAVSYQPGSVDVVAPGTNITSVGITGTGQFVGSGTQYAVAFVAGEAALIRSRYPDLTPAQVVRRIEATADQIGPVTPDPMTGWGLIDPAAAVTRVIPDEHRGPRPLTAAARASRWSSLRTKALVSTIMLALLALLLLVLRIRRMVLSAALDNPDVNGAAMAADSPTVARTTGRPTLPGPPPGTPAIQDGSAARTSPRSVGATAEPVSAGSAQAPSAVAGSAGSVPADSVSAHTAPVSARASGAWTQDQSDELAETWQRPTTARLARKW